MRFIPQNEKEALLDDDIDCLATIEQAATTTDAKSVRGLNELDYSKVFDAWDKARDSILETWQEYARETLPRSKLINRKVSDFLRQHPPHSREQKQMQMLQKILTSQWDYSNEKKLREIYDSNDSNGQKKSELLCELIDLSGIRPPAPLPYYPSIEKESIDLVCWLSIRTI